MLAVRLQGCLRVGGKTARLTVQLLLGKVSRGQIVFVANKLSNIPYISLHSRTVSDILISYNSYIKGVSCPTVQCQL